LVLNLIIKKVVDFFNSYGISLDVAFLKLTFIILIQQLIVIFKSNSTRYIIREWFTRKEIPFYRWYSLTFLKNIGIQQILGLGIIASFTVITFPIGIWLSSFEVGKSYPVVNMIGGIIQLITFPITINIMVNILQEMELNYRTKIGIIIIVLSKLLVILGCYYLYIGNRSEIV
jgi:hypothetical protein